MNIFGLCPFSKLVSPYVDGELDDSNHARTKRHLEGCELCRADYLKVVRAVEAVSGLIVPETPERDFELAFNQTSLRPSEAPKAAGSAWSLASISSVASRIPLLGESRRRLAALTFLILAAVVCVWFYHFLTPRINLKVATAQVSKIETVARDIHLQWLRGTLAFDFSHASAEQLREWLTGNAGVEANIATLRPAEDSGRYQFVGAKLIPFDGALAVSLAYLIDSHPVTLLVAREGGDVRARQSSFFSKNIEYRSENALKLLSWAQDGQEYVLVSDLPNFGQQSCFICHTDKKRRDLISGMRLEP